MKSLKSLKKENLLGLNSDCPGFLEDDPTEDINEFDEETFADEDEYESEEEE